MNVRIDWHSLGRALVVLTPMLVLAMVTRDPRWLRASLVTISGYIAMERSHLAPLGVVVQGGATIVGFIALFYAVLVPPIFVLGCAAFAAATLRLAVEGQSLRSAANFTFIPALYLACECSENLAPDDFTPTMLAFVPCMAVAMLPVLALAVLDAPASTLRIRRPRAPEARNEALREAVLAVACGVGLAAALVEWAALPSGQWVIWSAASVVTGDVRTSHDKLRDRLTGAVFGVPIGILLSFVVPHNGVSYGLTILMVMLTLVALEDYVIAFGSRCALAALALALSSGSVGIATERAVNVTLGCLVGIGCVAAVHRFYPQPADRR